MVTQALFRTFLLDQTGCPRLTLVGDVKGAELHQQHDGEEGRAS